jgi:hypothetical protein
MTKELRDRLTNGSDDVHTGPEGDAFYRAPELPPNGEHGDVI